MSIRETEEYKHMNPYRACEIAEGFGTGERSTQEEMLAAWQYIADTRLYRTLQGWYGRMVFTLIEDEIIQVPL